jgi:hypothetical protein
MEKYCKNLIILLKKAVWFEFCEAYAKDATKASILCHNTYF